MPSLADAATSAQSRNCNLHISYFIYDMFKQKQETSYMIKLELKTSHC
jgi:hypothetical protein